METDQTKKADDNGVIVPVYENRLSDDIHQQIVILGGSAWNILLEKNGEIVSAMKGDDA